MDYLSGVEFFDLHQWVIAQTSLGRVVPNHTFIVLETVFVCAYSIIFRREINKALGPLYSFNGTLILEILRSK